MYIVAALCMVFLRAWKIGQNEIDIAKEKHVPCQTDTNTDISQHLTRTHGEQFEKGFANIIRKTIEWKKV